MKKNTKYSIIIPRFERNSLLNSYVIKTSLQIPIECHSHTNVQKITSEKMSCSFASMKGSSVSINIEIRLDIIHTLILWLY